ncbi:MAG TPA: tetratricopeptide repeat protein [Gaiellaceae bacterium]|nr:tetratricopeptide repeat protein [Gaiellaceae bacterium]
MERKLATVLFVDLVDSTSLVAGADPEVARRRVTQFFERVSHCVTTHGGIVEKFAGDAVLAAFGVPQAHEDDAERAIRAALAMLESVGELGLEARVGVESGEVVVDESDSTFATGEAVTLAARLQQAAGAGEVLIGPHAYRLTSDRVQTEDVGPLDVKGFGDRIWTWRAKGVLDEVIPRRLAAPLVGRESELELLQNTYERAVRNRRAHLFTIYGDPGVGKSRLAREFVDGLEGATVLVGRSLPYGESVTYWPLAEMVKAAAGITDDDPLDVAVEKLRESCENEAIADLLGLASGVLEAVKGERSQQEIAWAAREWVERMAQDQPLVLAFEDIHWAEDALLDLIEHLAEWVRDAPLLILGLARAELLDVRPGWGGGRLRATAIELEPLGRKESEELVDALASKGGIEADARSALLDKTEGNPLFVEETMRMLAECEGRPLSEFASRIPDTLQALIAARIDRLPPDEKAVLQRASVIGRTFWGGAIADLTPEVEELEPVLETLLLREFLVPESRSTISGETAYRFKHVLIREVAYGGLSKSARADLHARFAAWLRERAGEELLEIRAYHLDHAAALLAELDGGAPPELAREAAEALETAGRRSLAREANRSARKQLLRALELEPTLERRYEAAKAAWRLGDLPAVSKEMERVRAEAAEEGDRWCQARALAALAEVTLTRGADVDEAVRLAALVLDVADANDYEPRFDALHVLNTAAWWRGRLTDSEGYARDQLALAQEAGRPDLESRAAIDLAGAHTARKEYDLAAPLVARALELAEESGSIVARGNALASAGDLAIYRDDFDEAQRKLEEARALYEEIGVASLLGRVLYRLAVVAWNQEDLERAERLSRESIRTLAPLEDRGTLCEAQRRLAEVLLATGKVDEAERYAEEALDTVGPQDMSSQASTRYTLARVRSEQGRFAEAEKLLREAVDIIDQTEYRVFGSDSLRYLVELLRDSGREDEADAYERRLEDAMAAAGRSS